MRCELCDCDDLEPEGGNYKCTKCGHVQTPKLDQYTNPLGGSVSEFAKKK